MKFCSKPCKIVGTPFIELGCILFLIKEDRSTEREQINHQIMFLCFVVFTFMLVKEKPVHVLLILHP